MKRKIQVIVETGKDLFGCFIPNTEKCSVSIHGSGKTARKAVEDFYICYGEAKQYSEEAGEEIPDYEFEFIFDVGAFFSYYMINITAFAEYSNLNASLLRQYSSGLKVPAKKTIERIKASIDRYRKDIDAGLLIDRPVLQYI